MDEITPLMPESPVAFRSIPPPDPVGKSPNQVSKLETSSSSRTPLEQVQEGLAPNGREAVLRFAHKKGLPVDDPVFELMSIVRENDERRAAMLANEGELVSRVEAAANSMEESVANGPERVRQACEAVSTVAMESKEAVDALRKSQADTEKLVKWAFGALIAVSVLLGINGLFLADIHRTITTINERRDELVAAVASVQQLQRLTGTRIQLMSDQSAWEQEWEKLKAAWTENPSEEQQARKTQLEQDHGALALRWKQLIEKEDRVYEK